MLHLLVNACPDSRREQRYWLKRWGNRVKNATFLTQKRIRHRPSLRHYFFVVFKKIQMNQLHTFIKNKVFIGLIMLLAIACNKDDEIIDPPDPPVPEEKNTISFIVEGGTSFNNLFIEYADFAPDSEGGYFEEDDATNIFSRAVWNDVQCTMWLNFSGKEPAQFSILPDDLPSIDKLFKIDIDTIELHAYELDFDITEYGEIGERIKGSFHGTMLDYTYDTAGELVAIKNGSFDLERTY